MTLIDQLKTQLRRDEGVRTKPYDDEGLPIRGKVTIGVGRNLTDVGLYPDEIDYLLDNDLARRIAALQSALPWTLNLDDARKGVLLNMAFNMGINGLLEFRNMLKLVQSGDYVGAAQAMLDSEWDKEVGDRAHRLSLQMESGDWQ